jgi:hypothetical protein
LFRIVDNKRVAHDGRQHSDNADLCKVTDNEITDNSCCSNDSKYFLDCFLCLISISRSLKEKHGESVIEFAASYHHWVKKKKRTLYFYRSPAQ